MVQRYVLSGICLIDSFISPIEYKAEAWEMHSHLSDNTHPCSPSNQAPSQHQSGHNGHSVSPLSYRQSQPANDYYHNTNIMNPNHSNAQSVHAMSQIVQAPHFNLP